MQKQFNISNIKSKTYALFWAKNNPKLQTLISNLSFKIATLFALYNSFLYILNRCWRTKIKVTETEAALLGLDRHDSSIELRDENDAPKNESINLQANELNASASKFKSFQESWDEDFLKEKSSLPPTLSKMSITQKTPQKQEDLSELVENNFSFAFPFKRKKSSLIPSFVQSNFLKLNQKYILIKSIFFFIFSKIEANNCNLVFFVIFH